MSYYVAVGFVTVATPIGSPTVRMRGDLTADAQETRNWVEGWVPVVGDAVLVAVQDGIRIGVIGVAQ